MIISMQENEEQAVALGNGFTYRLIVDCPDSLE